MLGTPYAAMIPMFKNGCPWYATWRWGTVSRVIHHILPFERVLPRVWDPEKFCSSDGAAEGCLEEADSEGLKVPLL